MNPQNIWAVGRNYSNHAKELGNPIPKRPIFFLKAGSTTSFEPLIYLPAFSANVEHEIEIALRFGPASPSGAIDDLEFDAAALALDLTARDLQNELKAEGLPWALAKSFRGSCPLSMPIPIPPTVPHFKFELQINGEVRQAGNTKDMLFDFESLRKFALMHFPVRPGDYLLTGTPAGVKTLRSGDRLIAIAQSELGHEIKSNWTVA